VVTEICGAEVADGGKLVTMWFGIPSLAGERGFYQPPFVELVGSRDRAVLEGRARFPLQVMEQGESLFDMRFAAIEPAREFRVRAMVGIFTSLTKLRLAETSLRSASEAQTILRSKSISVSVSGRHEGDG
jgi:hypothetical protein